MTYRAGTLYGTAYAGGNGSGNGKGSVYQIRHLGNNWVTLPISLLPVGVGPRARVVFGPDGHPYGTTQFGGDYNCGIVFDLIVPLSICKTVSCFWKENVLHSFQCGNNGDGRYPLYGDLIWDKQGNIYGTTADGGAEDVGAVYEMHPAGNSRTESVIYNFTGPDGLYPQNGVILDNNSNLFGTTIEGGSHGTGTVFKLTYSQGTGWTETLPYNFQNSSDGQFPYAGLIFDSSGNLYGATSDGGSGGGGTIFELSLSGDTWIFALLYSFSGTPGQSCGPRATLTMDAAGNFFGTTYCDGANNLGNVFKLTKTGNTYTYSSLYDFTGGNDGSYPISNVTFDANGNLYGTASTGGSQHVGVVWMITP